jgi:DNA-binding NtrC family response regulator
MPSSSSPSPPGAGSTRVSILVVDDDRVVGRSLCRAIAALEPEFQVDFAMSGEAALAAIATAPPHVVITDLDMGRVGGAELLETLVREHPQTVRIVHSSQKEPTSRSELRQLAHASFDKPAQPSDIVKAIERELGFRR